MVFDQFGVVNSDWTSRRRDLEAESVGDRKIVEAHFISGAETITNIDKHRLSSL